MSSKQGSDETGEVLNDGERWFSPFDSEGQVLHLRVLLFDLLDEVHEDALQLGYQPGLRQTEVLVQCCCLFIPEGQTVVFSSRRLVCSLSSLTVGCVGGARRGNREKLQLNVQLDFFCSINFFLLDWTIKDRNQRASTLVKTRTKGLWFKKIDTMMLCNAWVCAAVCLCVFAFWQDEQAVKSQSKHTPLTVDCWCHVLSCTGWLWRRTQQQKINFGWTAVSAGKLKVDTERATHSPLMDFNWPTSA